jgi:predicted acylesterase/phospholipase RssA
VVLSGGAAYAAYSVGVLEALCAGLSPATGQRKLCADLFVGTSMGAVNAAFMTSQPGRDPEQTAAELRRLWLDELTDDPRRGREGAFRFRGDPGAFTSPSSVLQQPLAALRRLADDSAYFAGSFLSRAIAFALSGEPRRRRVVELLSVSGLIVTDTFRQIVNRAIDYPGIRRSDTMLRLAATNWKNGELRLFGNEDMTDETGPRIVAASAAFAGLPPVVVNGELLMDGGYILSRPLLPAWEAGATTIHVIYHRRDWPDVPTRRFDNVIDVLDEFDHTIRSAMFNQDLQLVRDINSGLAALAGRGLDGRGTTDELRGVLRLAGRLAGASARAAPYREVTVHRYHPHVDLSGAFGGSNFRRENLKGLIDRGRLDAVNHDCAASGCVFPHGPLTDTAQGLTG